MQLTDYDLISNLFLINILRIKRTIIFQDYNTVIKKTTVTYYTKDKNLRHNTPYIVPIDIIEKTVLLYSNTYDQNNNRLPLVQSRQSDRIILKFIFCLFLLSSRDNLGKNIIANCIIGDNRIVDKLTSVERLTSEDELTKAIINNKFQTHIFQYLLKAMWAAERTIRELLILDFSQLCQQCNKKDCQYKEIAKEKENLANVLGEEISNYLKIFDTHFMFFIYVNTSGRDFSPKEITSEFSYTTKVTKRFFDFDGYNSEIEFFIHPLLPVLREGKGTLTKSPPTFSYEVKPPKGVEIKYDKKRLKLPWKKNNRNTETIVGNLCFSEKYFTICNKDNTSFNDIIAKLHQISFNRKEKRHRYFGEKNESQFRLLRNQIIFYFNIKDNKQQSSPYSLFTTALRLRTRFVIDNYGILIIYLIFILFACLGLIFFFLPLIRNLGVYFYNLKDISDFWIFLMGIIIGFILDFTQRNRVQRFILRKYFLIIVILIILQFAMIWMLYLIGIISNQI